MISRIILVAALIFGFLIRADLIFHLPLWHDEAYSLWAATASWSEIVQAYVDSVHPPGYYLLLKAWTTFTDQLAWARMSSLFLWALNCGTIYIFVKKHGRPVLLPWVTVTVYALSGYFLVFDWQVRMYTGLLTLILWSLYVYLELIHKKSKHTLLIFTFVNTLGLYFDYGFIWYLVPLMAHALWLIVKKKQRLSIFLSLIVSAVLFLFLHQSLLATYNYGIEGVAWTEYFLRPSFVIPFFLGSHGNGLSTLIIALITVYGASVWIKHQHPHRELLRFFAMVIFFSIAVFDFSLYVRPIFHVRSFQVLGLVTLLFQATAMSSIVKNKQTTLAVILLGFLASSALYMYRDLPTRGERYLISYYPWKQQAKSLLQNNPSRVYIRPHASAETPILFWGLQYSLDGKETLGSQKIPYSIVRFATDVPTNCELTWATSAEIYACP